VQPGVVSDGHRPGFVDGVGADPPVRVDHQAVRGGFGTCGIGLGGGAAGDGAVWTVAGEATRAVALAGRARRQPPELARRVVAGPAGVAGVPRDEAGLMARRKPPEPRQLEQPAPSTGSGTELRPRRQPPNTPSCLSIARSSRTTQ
jgi:hypothetical protein